MERVGFVLKVRADRLSEYRERHRHVWPEMLSALRDCGWHNYSLFLRADGLLFGYLETDSFARALAEMSRRDVNQRWQHEMAPFFEDAGGRPADRALERLDEVFHLD
jgi:L-rhamnose mutarotase